jgi:hypothetical protein
MKPCIAETLFLFGRGLIALVKKLWSIFHRYSFVVCTSLICVDKGVEINQDIPEETCYDFFKSLKVVISYLVNLFICTQPVNK